MLLLSFALTAWLAGATPIVASQNVVVVLDDSGSMRDRMPSNRRLPKIEAAKKALLTVLAELPDGAQLGVLLLNGGPRDHWVVSPGPVEQDRVRAAISQIRAAGNTPLGRSMKAGTDALLALRGQQRYGTYKLLIVTDGEASDQRLVDAYLPDILSRGIVVDVIGVDMSQDHSLATEVHTYRRADDEASLQKAISETVLGESAADAQDAGESDFELLAGLPDEVAAEALETLAQVGNQPIREKPSWDASPQSSRRGIFFAPRQTQRGGSSGFSFMRMLTGCCGFACIGGLIVMLLLVFASSRSK
jgi:hypothetical protein